MSPAQVFNSIINYYLDADISVNNLLDFYNAAINKINLSLRLRLPQINLIDIEKDVDFSQEAMVVNVIFEIIRKYICYCVARKEGMASEIVLWEKEYINDLLIFANSFVSHLKKEYVLEKNEFDNHKSIMKPKYRKMRFF